MGVRAFVLVELPITLLGASIGVWLFYIQHQFEDTLWAHDESWNQHEAALHGSSHYHLPGILRWFTANIGVHHVHHLCSRIPYYRLPWVLRDHPELGATGRLTFIGSLKCVRLVLWDESRSRLVSFRDMRKYRAHAEPLCSGLSRPKTHVAEERPCGEPPVRRERSRGTCEDGEPAHRLGERREPFAELRGARDKPH
jgi:omega-6 fatty acid desaturase (delta-12 desaturase)